MLVGPGGIASRGVYDPKDRVGTNEIPWINGRAILAGIAGQLIRIDGSESPVHACRRSPIQKSLVNINTLFVFGSCSDWGRARSAKAWIAGYSVACRCPGRIERAVKCDIVIYSLYARGSARHHRRQARERVGRFRG